MRHDGGDAETGFGLDLGGVLALARRGTNPVELGVEATRRESANDNAGAEHGIGLRLTARW